jgi:predicted lipoprotein with Yx(FWY)xxD motif
MISMRIGGRAATIAMVLAACGRSNRSADTTSGTRSDSTLRPAAVRDSAAGESTPEAAKPSGGEGVSASSSALSRSIAAASAAGVGTYLTDANGRALYMFARDGKNASTCAATDGCAIAWPPLAAITQASANPLVQPEMLGTIRRNDNRSQSTYNGMPLYYYDDDEKAGDTKGQGKQEFGGLWYLVSPSGHAITASTRGRR